MRFVVAEASSDPTHDDDETATPSEQARREPRPVVVNGAPLIRAKGFGVQFSVASLQVWVAPFEGVERCARLALNGGVVEEV
jgi:hypothetical protein